ncbi:hypothetical protein PV327_005296 [Microctonus hyperodae]|uniref:Uncharacterized protein n=1 Tax=Microctonus hyperodae TaxID=165561 RepID=A0AA39G2I2_MICHY|nr:hypothetical protein PV327_005296 [Microctonus hyperodae]
MYLRLRYPVFIQRLKIMNNNHDIVRTINELYTRTLEPHAILKGQCRSSGDGTASMRQMPEVDIYLIQHSRNTGEIAGRCGSRGC